MTRIGIMGASGRMGHAIALAVEDFGAIVSGGIDRPHIFGETGAGVSIMPNATALAEAKSAPEWLDGAGRSTLT